MEIFYSESSLTIFLKEVQWCHCDHVTIDILPVSYMMTFGGMASKHTDSKGSEYQTLQFFQSFLGFWMSVRPIVSGQPCFWQRGSGETSVGDAECLGA